MRHAALFGISCTVVGLILSACAVEEGNDADPDGNDGRNSSGGSSSGGSSSGGSSSGGSSSGGSSSGGSSSGGSSSGGNDAGSGNDAGKDSGPTLPPPTGGGPAFDPGTPSSVLQVGPGKTYATPCAAIAAASANAEIDIAAGTYTDSCEINKKGLRLKGVGGRPKIDLSGTDHPFAYKGIYVVSADNVYIENLELMGAHISAGNGENAAGIRVTGHDLVVHGCYFHDNQNGILGGPLDGAGSVTVEYSEFAKNGRGNGCNSGGCTHQLYLNDWAKVVFRFNWSHDIANDTADKGHLLKSRAKETHVLYNRLTGETAANSYEINMPNGGLGIVVGNVIQKSANSGNSVSLAYGEEGLTGTTNSLYVAANTFVSDRATTNFIKVTGAATLAAKDNIFVGAGTPSSTGALSADNLSGTDPMFVNRAGYDFHLKAGSPALGKAVDPGSAGAFSLTPAYEYVHPTQGKTRATRANSGAFE